MPLLIPSTMKGDYKFDKIIMKYELRISGVALQCFRSFLTDRIVRVKIDNEYSYSAIVTCGTAKGSFLGPSFSNINLR